MKPIEVGFDGSFKTIGNIGSFVNVILTPTKAQIKDWPTKHICNTIVWSCVDQENPKLLYVNKDGKLYVMNFEPFGE
jgi:hypothetical protein